MDCQTGAWSCFCLRDSSDSTILSGIQCPFINMHWGWSPDYRGEGIIPALALEGPYALGVTVHLIDLGIDSGEIISRLRPEVDERDNFYSLGLKLCMLGTDLFKHAFYQFAQSEKN